MSDSNHSLIPVFLTAQLEKAANQALKYAPVTLMQLKTVKGRTFALQLEKPNVALLVRVSARRLHFQSQWDEQPDVMLSGPALSIVKMLNQDTVTPATLMHHQIRIDGDQALAMQFMDILQDLELDWEGALADVIGEAAAHQISNVARTGFGWLRNASTAILSQARHLTTQEQEWVPARNRFQSFQRDVETLRDDTDRLQARIQQLKSTLDSQEDAALETNHTTADHS